MRIRAAPLPRTGPPVGRPRGVPLTAFAGILLVIVSSAVTFVAATQWFTPETAQSIWKWAADRGHAAFQADIRLRDELFDLPASLLHAVRTPDVPQLVIDIKFKHFQKLREKRAEALALGLLIQAPDDQVPATVRVDDQSVRVKLRLKGDFTEHLEGRKWSYRIRVRGKESLFGMRRLSIQHPKTRGFHAEILFFETLRHLGVLAPRYFFVDVTVNGEALGLMAVEEHFSKEILESNGRRDGVIVRFDESLYWAEGAERAEGAPEGDRSFNVYQNAPIDAFRSSRVGKSEKLSKDHAVAVGLLRSFVAGHLPASEVFDAALLGRFLAAAEFWGAWHAVRWHNQRFYLNPISAKLEPIGFDATLQSRRPLDQIIAQERGLGLARDMLADAGVYGSYKTALKRLAEEVLHGDLGARLRAEEDRQLAILQTEFFLLRRLPEGELRARAERVLARGERDWRAPPVADSAVRTGAISTYPTLLHAFVVESPAGTYLELVNAVPEDVEIRAIQWTQPGSDTELPFQTTDRTEFPLRLPPRARGSLPEPRRVYFSPLDNPRPYTLTLAASIVGRDQSRAIVAKKYFPALDRNPIPSASVEEQLSAHPYLRLDRGSGRLTVEPGTWQVDDSLLIPAGYRLALAAGTTLRFASGRALISHGPLEFSGEPGEEIVLEGQARPDGTTGHWLGIAVLDAKAPSTWSHVVIRGTSGVEQGNWQLTGGVTFYRSDVVMNDCRLEENRAEDALNIVHSKFELNRIRIVDASSDAIDSDFSEGTIRDGDFENIGFAGGGDGVDVSGSTVTVIDTRFRAIGDKALSVGEQSRMTAERVTVNGAGTGAASKDGSSLDIIDSKLLGIRGVPLMAYVKKPEFGHGRITGKNLVFDGAAPHAVAQKNSRIVLDGAPVPTEDVDVEELYGTLMRKAERG